MVDRPTSADKPSSAEELSSAEEPVAEKPARETVSEKPAVTRGTAGLKIVLWLSGLVFMFFGSWAFLPKETIQRIAAWYGGLIGEELAFGGAAIEVYMLRLIAASSLVFGLFLIIAAINPVRFRVLVTFAIVLSGAYAVAAPIAGQMSGLSFRWYVLDAGPALLMFVLLLIFRKQARPRAV